MTRDRSQTVGAALAVAWLAVFVVADLATPPTLVILSPLFAISPLIASAVLPARPTGAFALLALVASAFSGVWNGTFGTAQQVVRMVDVALVGLVAVVIATVRVRRERRHERVSAIAEVAQRTILPVLPDRLGEVVTGVRYQSAAQDAVVGGDLYDYYFSDQHVRFLIGDVRGKGISAIEHAARVIRAFRQSAATQRTLAEVAEDMSAYLERFFDDEEFVTALLVDATEHGRLTLVSCGHPPALLVRPDGTAALLEVPPGLPLGLGGPHTVATASWRAGDRLLMYTDGLSEARDEHGTFLSVPDLAPLLPAGQVGDALDRVLAAVERHVPSGELSDDLALVLLENTRAPDRSEERALQLAAGGPAVTAQDPQDPHG